MLDGAALGRPVAHCQLPPLEALLGCLAAAGALLGIATVVIRIGTRDCVRNEAREKTVRAVAGLWALAGLTLLVKSHALVGGVILWLVRVATSRPAEQVGLVLLGAGLGCVVFWLAHRAKSYKERFVRDAFMIFYVLAQADGSHGARDSQGLGHTG